jgi:hypothetical protein
MRDCRRYVAGHHGALRGEAEPVTCVPTTSAIWRAVRLVVDIVAAGLEGYAPTEEKVKPAQILKEQHRNVKALFKKIEKATGAGQRRTLLDQLAADLKLHMQIEENVFYPAVKELETKKAEDMVLEAYEEHAVVKLVLAELPKIDLNDERFEAKMTVLQELIEHHVEEEEEEMFKLAGRLKNETLQFVSDQMMAEMASVKTGAARRRG